jgi:hypothetical protein
MGVGKRYVLHVKKNWRHASVKWRREACSK